MKKYAPFIMILLLTACGQQDKADPTPAETEDSLVVISDSTEAFHKDSTHIFTDAEKAIVTRSLDVLATLQDSNYTAFAEFIHPDLGIRFSPYGYIDKAKEPVLTTEKFLELVKSGKKIIWGTEDGSGDPINMSWTNYAKRYVYEHDYRNAPKISVNKFLGSGNSLNNLDSIYKGAVFSEHYFPGFDPKYQGMDWATLRLVFREKGNRLYLVAIVHDQWTT